MPHLRLHPSAGEAGQWSFPAEHVTTQWSVTNVKWLLGKHAQSQSGTQTTRGCCLKKVGKILDPILYKIIRIVLFKTEEIYFKATAISRPPNGLLLFSVECSSVEMWD